MRQGLVGCTQGRAMLEPLEARLLLDGAAGQQAIELFGISPALFVENQGQWPDESVRYAFQGSGANVAFTDAGLLFQVFQREQAEDADAPGAWDDPFAPEGTVMRGAEFSVSFDGANDVAPAGLDQSQSVFNYYVGDQADWRSGVPAYETISYPNLYDGIDLYTWGRRDSLKYEFHVAPGADYGEIQVSYDRVEGLWLGAEGALHIETELGELIDDAPYIYQNIAGERVDVAGAFELIDADTYAFEITAQYDPGSELIIDPYMMWSSYLGGSNWDEASGIAVDSVGNVLVAGGTQSGGWVSGGFDTTYSGDSDAFVAKIGPSGQHIWSTYVGGASGDWAYDIAVDSAENVLLAGSTSSSGWVSGGYDTTFNGVVDAFVAKLSPGGEHIWSTYLGETSLDPDRARGVAVDSLDNVLVGGQTWSSGWVSGGFDTTREGGMDGFAAKLSASGEHVWSTYVGGSDYDDAEGIAVDSLGNVLVAGWTQSSGWASGGFDTTLEGRDAFALKISPSGEHVWSTYLGGPAGVGSGDDWGNGITADSLGNVVVGGQTRSAGWVWGGFDTSFSGYSDAFVAKLSPSGGHIWSTYVGETSSGGAVAVDSLGNVLVAGKTGRAGWVSGGFDTTHNGSGDGFVAELSLSGGHVWSTYLGGSDNDAAGAIAVDSLGNVLVAGATPSPGWVWGGFDTTYGGNRDGFVVKICEGYPALGDANGDGVANGADYTIWSDNYLLQPVPAWLEGGWMFANFNADDIVDDADYTIWADSVPSVPIPGDTNRDGAVDGADYTIWADHYLDQPVPAWVEGGWMFGNFTAGDTVDGADYTIWADNFTGVGGGSAGALPAAGSAGGEEDVLARAGDDSTGGSAGPTSLLARREDDPHMATQTPRGHASRPAAAALPAGPVGPGLVGVPVIPRVSLHALPSTVQPMATRAPTARDHATRRNLPTLRVDDEIDLLAAPDLSVVGLSV